jgi:hypothetical protein
MLNPRGGVEEETRSTYLVWAVDVHGVEMRGGKNEGRKKAEKKRVKSEE